MGVLGLGVAAAGFFIGNTLEDAKKFWDEQKQSMFGLGATDAEMESSTTDSPAQHTPSIENGPELEGLTPSAIYDLFFDQRHAVREWAFQRWCEGHGLEQTGARWEYFRENASDFLAPNWYANTELLEGDSVSMFTYQMTIRETAARRNQGRTVSTTSALAAGLIGAPAAVLSFVGSELVWRVGAWLGLGQANSWSSADAREAPGYIADPLLTWCWTLVDFPGHDAANWGSYSLAGQEYMAGSTAYVSFISSAWTTVQDANEEDMRALLEQLLPMMPPPSN